ncbi:MAG: bifunctional folylpolyglutamate synthase/dihydrofolate synthase, partial [Chloroflexales bacterium]|nr:bifunctional folylpolyglutamate synthase/dihydrofolate synthase [Chloroflexales bacterium]
GLWTSPHLNSYRERIQVDRQLISAEELIRLVEWLRPAVENFNVATYGRPSTFDLGFAIALRHFAERGVELAVLEVGLGGRYDVVNVITPLVSVISSISYDHMNVLGATLAEIADNKAGIMKAGVPAVTVQQAPEAAAVLLRVAADVGSPLWVAAESGIGDYRLALDDEAMQPTSYNLQAAYPVTPVPAALRGSFQHENARLALGAACLLREQGWELPDSALAQGLVTAQWPGRLEVVGHAPLTILDGAHNGDSAEKLLAALRAEFRFERLILVLGTSRDKDIPAIVAALAPHADLLILTRSRHPRAHADLDLITAAARPYLRTPALIIPDIAAALAEARVQARTTDLICVTGSLFVVGSAREALGLALSD